MKHYLNVILYILKKGHYLNKSSLIYAYFKIIFKAHLYFKIFLNLGYNRKELHYISILGYEINFLNYPLLLNLFEEIFIQEVYKVEGLSSNAFIIDCGSNIGLSILYFKSKYPDCHVLAFEPDEKTFKILEGNILNNALTGITLLNFALSSENGERLLFETNNEVGSLNKSFIKTSRHNASLKIQTKRLSEFINHEIDLIKIDTEGAEGEIIEELCASSKIRMVKNILLGYHEQCPISLSELINLLHKNSFQISNRNPISVNSIEQVITIHNVHVAKTRAEISKLY